VTAELDDFDFEIGADKGKAGGDLAANVNAFNPLFTAFTGLANAGANIYVAHEQADNARRTASDERKAADLASAPQRALVTYATDARHRADDARLAAATARAQATGPGSAPLVPRALAAEAAAAAAEDIAVAAEERAGLRPPKPTQTALAQQQRGGAGSWFSRHKMPVLVGGSVGAVGLLALIYFLVRRR
jgi:hypothetical protein